MKKSFRSTCCFLPALFLFAAPVFALGGGAGIAVPQVPMEWGYDKPGVKFWEGLPIGNGRFAAMVRGAVDREIIPFNDETLWTGGPYNPNNPDGPRILDRVRKHAFAHDWQRADAEVQKLNSDPQSVQAYQPMGRLHLDFPGHAPDKVSRYWRALNMDDGIVTVRYTHEGVNYTREIFASYPDQVIVIRLSADQPGKLDLDTRLSSLQPSATAFAAPDSGSIALGGTTLTGEQMKITNPRKRILPPQMRWHAILNARHDGGTLRRGSRDDTLIIRGATTITLVLAGATNWVDWNDVSADARARCERYIRDATIPLRPHSALIYNNPLREDYLRDAVIPHTRLRQRHLDDYRPLFAACRLHLGDDPAPRATTTARMEALRKGATDPAYEARYFQYGRYLLLAAAREGTLAFNNHNIWLDDIEGRWRGRWTLNINLQECYWPVENTNLPVLNDSLLRFTEQLAKAGARTARELYNSPGWCAHHGTDIWFNTAPTDVRPCWATYPLAGVWLLQQLYEHHLYAPDDRAYLRRLYPLLKGATEFVLAYLTPEPNSGHRHLVTCPSTSPENSFRDDKGKTRAVSYGSAGDIQLIRRLLRDYTAAAATLGEDPTLAAAATAALKRLPPHKIGRHGQLQEWYYDFNEAEVTHRHLSHLYAAYPDDDITSRKTPALADAVRVALKRRGTNNRGWSGAWKINQYARLGDAEAAHAILRKMLVDVSLHPGKEDSRISPSFEGNQGIQGVTAGMAELLLQSHDGVLALLPALPKAWKNGSIEGLRARGGYTLALAWRESTLTHATLAATQDTICHLRTPRPVKVYHNDTELPATAHPRPEGSLVAFPVKAGQTYWIR
ncbi:MAG: glycoside hydrolase family 95 protein [Puniceicoccales bacterium]|jgi:alpha-L-fucosidase 2|nr:glycoside hydrolase family 95 protein [Puniceicoccales bacterium]